MAFFLYSLVMACKKIALETMMNQKKQIKVLAVNLFISKHLNWTARARAWVGWRAIKRKIITVNWEKPQLDEIAVAAVLIKTVNCFYFAFWIRLSLQSYGWDSNQPFGANIFFRNGGCVCVCARYACMRSISARNIHATTLFTLFLFSNGGSITGNDQCIEEKI